MSANGALVVRRSEQAVCVTSRQLCNDDDFQAVRVLLQRVNALDSPLDYCTVGDLDWWCATDEDVDAIQQARIWIDDGSEVATNRLYASAGFVAIDINVEWTRPLS